MSVIRVVARITPMSVALPLMPEEFGHATRIETCCVTDPRSGLKYGMETSIIIANSSSEKASEECASVPGFVCATGSFLSQDCGEDLRECASLTLPNSIRQKRVQQLLKIKRNRSGPKLHLDSKKTGAERKHAQKNLLLRRLLPYFIEDECLICGEIAPEKNVLEHMSRHVNSKSYQCDCCQLPFTNPRALYLHKLVKSAESPYRCDICRTTYQRKHLLTVHQLKNHSRVGSQFAPSGDDQSVWKQRIPPAYSCSGCGERLPSLDDVSVHRDLHCRQECSFQCLFCGKSFVSVCLLRYHTHVRVVSQKFSCKSCGEEYPSARALQQHGKMHSVAAWVCEICGDKKFYFEKTFLKHMRLIHGTN